MILENARKMYIEGNQFNYEKVLVSGLINPIHIFNEIAMEDYIRIHGRSIVFSMEPVCLLHFKCTYFCR